LQIYSFYVPGSPYSTHGLLRGKQGWFTERQKQIAITRIIRDDRTKKEQHERITLHDVKISLTDSKLWVHLIITFLGYVLKNPILYFIFY
jgi:hypothetical protein